MTNLNIVFAGTPEFALPSLDALIASRHRLLAVYTQPDRPRGRGQKLLPSAVKNWALSHELPVYQPLNFKESHDVAQLEALKPDVLIVIAYGLILPSKVLAIPKFGCINVHASLLPRWRGASPIQQALLHGDRESGVTLMQMNAGMDTGDILATASYVLAADETAGTLHDKLATLSPSLLLSTLEALGTDGTNPEPQNNALATYAPKINKEDARINWHNSAASIDRLVRAFNPWPIAYTQMGQETLRIHRATIEPTQTSVKPGTVLSFDKTGMLVATSHQILRVQEIQFAGGKVISIADCLNAGRESLFDNLVFQ